MIHAAVYGYGNLGRAACRHLQAAEDFQLLGVVSHRAAGLQGQPDAPRFCTPQQLWQDPAIFGHIDVLLNCGGSARDLPKTTPALAAHFCVVDSFDTHAAIPAHFAAVETAARAAGTLCVICAGWDPGLFSLTRLLGNAFLPGAQPSTFWGPGVSQGHSDALRRLPGVADARQYTVPQPEALQAARAGRSQPAAGCHRRVCYIVPTPDADRKALAETVRSLPNYFAGYETDIHFVSAEELAAEHSRLPHGGCVVATGGAPASGEASQRLELQLSLASNPDFTAGVLVAAARAAARLAQSGARGCRTMLDIPPALYSPLDAGSQRARFL